VEYSSTFHNREDYSAVYSTPWSNLPHSTTGKIILQCIPHHGVIFHIPQQGRLFCSVSHNKEYTCFLNISVSSRKKSKCTLGIKEQNGPKNDGQNLGRLAL